MEKILSLKETLGQQDAIQLLTARDSQLQGIKDSKLREVLKQLPASDIVVLAQNAVSGKIRDLAGRITSK